MEHPRSLVYRPDMSIIEEVWTVESLGRRIDREIQAAGLAIARSIDESFRPFKLVSTFTKKAAGRWCFAGAKPSPGACVSGLPTIDPCAEKLRL